MLSRVPFSCNRCEYCRLKFNTVYPHPGPRGGAGGRGGNPRNRGSGFVRGGGSKQ